MDSATARDSRRIKKLVRLGIPESVRGKAWRFMANADKNRKSKVYDVSITKPVVNANKWVAIIASAKLLLSSVQGSPQKRQASNI